MVELAVFPSESVLTPAQLPAAAVQGLYVHIPFCFHKCHYCDFYSITQQSPQRMGQFVDRILLEAAQWSGRAIRPKTVFFGGGTPSLLPIADMQRLIEGLSERFDLSAVDEWTVEANPATVNLEYCRMLREMGVDRLSFGAQSFDAAELVTLERHHEPGDVERSVAIARAAGFGRMNVDLIFAIPGQSLASWKKSMERAIALGTPHVSCYALTYEPNTAMTARKRAGEFKAAEECLELEMLHYTRDRLSEAGIAAYEVSNFAKRGEACRHNLNYWQGGNYIGLGPAAASHIQGWRWKNRPHLTAWENAIDAGRVPAIDVETLSPLRRAGELAMLMLRLERGIEFNVFFGRSGFDARELFGEVIGRFSKAGLIEASESAARLTRAGLNVADALGAEFLAKV
jgi:oxygen-independent coproporphyrinogen-3 oxidase